MPHDPHPARGLAASPSGPAITDVIFDLGHVLVDWDPRYLYRVRFAGDEAAMEDFLSRVCGPDWHRRVDAGLPWEQAIAELLPRYPAQAAHIRAYRSGWAQMFAGEVPGTLALLRRLQSGGYRLHALSNYPVEPVDFLYQRYPWMDAFEHVVISGRLGVAKPDRRIYEHLLAVIERSPRHCLFIDDRPENVDGARALGIDAIRFEDAGSLARALAARGVLVPCSGAP
ncbi:MAG: HAD family phosphatase [Gammaproteobacteria bacterium]|nr:HAD family phosphatase [Gammaproteobacteria bacterium]